MADLVHWIGHLASPSSGDGRPVHGPELGYASRLSHITPPIWAARSLGPASPATSPQPTTQATLAKEASRLLGMRDLCARGRPEPPTDVGRLPDSGASV